MKRLMRDTVRLYFPMGWPQHSQDDVYTWALKNLDDGDYLVSYRLEWDAIDFQGVTIKPEIRADMMSVVTARRDAA